MSGKPENPFAFPVPYSPDNHGWPQQEGMTLRDHFAGQAMLGVIVSENIGALYASFPPETVARKAYAIADAMLAERVK